MTDTAVLEASGPYAELVERRMLLLMCNGAGTTLSELSARIDGFSADLPTDERSALFAEFADLVDAARTAEEQAVALMR